MAIQQHRATKKFFATQQYTERTRGATNIASSHPSMIELNILGIFPRITVKYAVQTAAVVVRLYSCTGTYCTD